MSACKVCTSPSKRATVSSISCATRARFASFDLFAACASRAQRHEQSAACAVLAFEQRRQSFSSVRKLDNQECDAAGGATGCCSTSFQRNEPCAMEARDERARRHNDALPAMEGIRERQGNTGGWGEREEEA